VIFLPSSVEGSDALLQGKQTLVDFSSILLGFLAGVDNVSSSLATSQVDEGHFAEEFASVLDREHEDGMRTRTLGVGPRLTTRPGLESVVDDVHNLFDLGDVLLSEVDDVHPLLGILSAGYTRALVQQVVELAAVNLVET